MSATAEQLEAIAAAADRLEDWLGKNAGSNDDWPVEIKVDEEGAADQLSAMLTALKDALAPYRDARLQTAGLSEDGLRLRFHCPGCDCVHSVIVQTPSTPGGWRWNGDLVRPTLSPSILVEYGRAPRPDRPQRCHSFVKDGSIQFCSDSQHALAGKTVPLQRRF